MRSCCIAFVFSLLVACSSESQKKVLGRTADAPTVAATPPALVQKADTNAFQRPTANTDSTEWQRRLPYFDRADQKDHYQHYDFSSLWKFNEEQALGFIGPHYERLRIVLLDVKPDEQAPDLYHVKGKSKVSQAVCAFTGIIRLRYVFQQKNPLEELGPEEQAYVRQRGMVVADYELREDRKGAHTGIFSGVLMSFWLLTGDEHIRYDELDAGADGYCNNQFEGEWRSYDGKLLYKASWGDFRIPDSGPLDIGAGEFMPAAEYQKYGWKSYTEALHSTDEKKWARERNVWW